MSGILGAMLPGGSGLENYAEDKWKKSGIGKITDEGFGGYLADKWNNSGLGGTVNKAENYFNPQAPAQQSAADYASAGGIMTPQATPALADFSNIKLQYPDSSSMALPAAGSPLPNLTQQGSVAGLMDTPEWAKMIAQAKQ